VKAANARPAHELRIEELEGHRRQWRRKAQDLEKEVERLRAVILTGGAMYRAERAAMGIPGGVDESAVCTRCRGRGWDAEDPCSDCNGGGATQHKSPDRAGRNEGEKT
jgi:hypothetical protein